MLIRILTSTPNLVSGIIIFLIVATALIISLSIHEFAHAYIADRLGDPTAKMLGRVTLDPRAHLDPTGTILLLLAGFGWGKPVPISERNLSSPKRDSALIALAGPVSNIILAVLFAGIFNLFSLVPNSLFGLLVYFIIQYNVILAVFNLLPVNPLDGFKVVNGILPEKLSYQWMQMAPYGIWILLILVFTGVIDQIIYPLMNFILHILQI